MKETFKCYRVFETESGVETRIVEMGFDDLPEGEVLVKVSYSALNYKDALSASGHKGITKQYPHTPGIDASGVVVESTSAEWSKGDEVIVTSYDLGMNTHGGFSEYIRVPAEWVVGLPSGMDLKQAMVLGTAGLTAGISLRQMEKMGQNPAMGPVLVTGSTGGVGSMALQILQSAGYEVMASTGSQEKKELLIEQGVKEVFDRAFLQEDSKRPLHKPLWAGAIDTVGGITLAEVIKRTGWNGSIAVCGLVESPNFATTVYPFLLNGLNLLGVESATYPKAERKMVWDKLSGEWQPNLNKVVIKEIGLQELDENIGLMLQGKTFGKVVVKL